MSGLGRRGEERGREAHDSRTLLSRLGSCWGCRLTVLAICLPDALHMSGVDPPVHTINACLQCCRAFGPSRKHG